MKDPVYRRIEKTFQEIEKCDLVEIDLLNQFEPLLPAPKDSPYNELFKVVFKQIRESGLQDAAKQKAMKEKKKKVEDTGSVSELNPWPAYIQRRIELWDKYKAQFVDELAAKPEMNIAVTLPDGKIVEATAWRTTPYEIAKSISQGLADSTIIARVNNELWDLDRPLEGDCSLQLLRWDNPEAQAVFWHSSAHMLGEALERVYGGCLCYGPPIEEGFYYDMFYPEKGISSSDFTVLEGLVKKIAKEKQPFERLELTKEQLLEMFNYNPFKVKILQEKVTTPTTTVYRCGPLIDLCRGPHVRNTGKVKAFKVTKNSSSYWEGRADAETLQRVYGVSFPDPKQLKEWEIIQEEAAKRDHRKIGREQELFFFHELSPGSCFFLPRGAHIYNTLINFIREQYRERGFQEVVSPNMYNTKLWQTSGHWAHYSENMFSFDIEKETFALKPMNCPGHCVMFDNRNRSWRELPLRLADFGVLHRNELSGALTGLTRVRRFQQDDAHIFCTPQQIEQEMLGALDFLERVYSTFGFTFQLRLATRPEKYLGDAATWDHAEKALEESLNRFGKPWQLCPADGAFYGPKIDITIQDALRRSHQCATIQLDFQLPERFNLSYVSETGEKKRPVIIHRAVLGSVERMIAVLMESYGGKWPFWLSPRQACVVPVGPQLDSYAIEVKDKLFAAGFMCEVDTDAGDTLNKKVRNAQLAQFNYILVVGDREKTSGTVNVRTRDNKVHGEMSVQALIDHFTTLIKEKTLSADSELLKF
ncbi:Threonine--tRNA ligase, cytoplasmic [Eumeta japonica]|uniref:threonine--tRNA ligase n=1 Tax=Eumeta variegata TaxID=151549 RepID=A0A4C1VAT7_EUMVA|nr:Threonine--tRNA ligase, cytoplasmic [Eumeta japonica]